MANDRWDYTYAKEIKAPYDDFIEFLERVAAENEQASIALTWNAAADVYYGNWILPIIEHIAM
jgi:hypothetical protein